MARPSRAIWPRLWKSVRSLPGWVARWPRAAQIAVAAVLFFVILTMVIDSAIYYDKIHAGVSVAQQSLSGKTKDQAVEILTDVVESARSQTITLKSGTKTWETTPDDLGQMVDLEASAQAALDVTRKGNFVVDLARRLKLYFNGENHPLVGEVDPDKFDALIALVAGDLDVEPVNAGLLFKEDLSVEVVEGISGFVVDQDSLRRQLTDALFSHNATEIVVPMVRKAPDVMAEDSDPAISQVQTMIGADLQLKYFGPMPVVSTTPPEAPVDPAVTTTTEAIETITIRDQTLAIKTATFTPAQIAAYIDFTAEDNNGVMTLVPFISAAKMSPFFAGIEGPMTVAAVDAHLTSDGANVWVEPMIEGSALDREATAEALTAAALRTDNRLAEADVRSILPEVTTEELTALNITQELGRFETFWDKGTEDREWNVKLCTERASNVILAPGQEYSFADTVGPRTEAAGFRKAPGIVDGELDEVLGGGICQVSTTLFNAIFLAGLQITERWNHSIFIDHYPTGLDATVTAGAKPRNLRFLNDTGGHIWIYGRSDGITNLFVIYGTDDGREVYSELHGPFVTTKNTSTTFVEDPNLGPGSTDIYSLGQDAMKYKVIRVVSWPDGSTTSDTFISEWKLKPMIITVPTSTTTTLPLTPPATVAPGP
jgi:vancomycin resistance protein YoaR